MDTRTTLKFTAAGTTVLAQSRGAWFLNQSVNTRTSDRMNMNFIENANKLLAISCPVEGRSKNGKLERMVVARNFGERLSKTENSPPSTKAFARALPSIRFVISNQLQTLK